MADQLDILWRSVVGRTYSLKQSLICRRHTLVNTTLPESLGCRERYTTPSYRLVLCCVVLSYLVIQRHRTVLSCVVLSYLVTQRHRTVLSCVVLSYLVLCCLVMYTVKWPAFRSYALCRSIPSLLTNAVCAPRRTLRLAWGQLLKSVLFAFSTEPTTFGELVHGSSLVHVSFLIFDT